MLGNPEAFLNFPAFGWYTNGEMLRARLDRYDFDGWSDLFGLFTLIAEDHVYHLVDAECA